MASIVCPNCKGKGKVWDTSDAANPVIVALTMGMSLIDGKVTCKVCKGKGLVDVS